MLFHGDVGVGVCYSAVPVAVYLFAVAKQEAYLRTGMDEELQTAVLAEGQMCQEGYFHIVHGACVAQCGIVLIVLVPTVLREVQLDLCTANHAEIFLGDVSGCHTTVDAHQILLLDRGREAYAIQIDASIDAHSEVVALLTHLRMQGQYTCTHQQGEYDDCSQVHVISYELQVTSYELIVI